MKKLLLASVLTLNAGSAFAADLSIRKEPPAPPAPIVNWTGLYVGLNLGGGWNANNDYNNNWAPYFDPRFPAGPRNFFFWPSGSGSNNNTGGLLGGGQVGYNHQMNAFVAGVETDIQGSTIRSGNSGNTIFYPSPFPHGLLVPLLPGNGGNVRLPWFGTARGRIGYLVTPELLVYATGGFAYGEVEAWQWGEQWNNTRIGWTVGGGLEWMFTPNWSAKIEYLYTDLSGNGRSGSWGWNTSYGSHSDFNVLRLGANYYFNWSAPAPVAAKY